MLEESVSSSPTFWAALFSWFTPTVFFVLLQLVIGTIYITSTLANNHKQHHHHYHQQQQHQDSQENHVFQPQLARSPSVLQRLKSINYYSPYSYRSQDPYNQNTQEFQTHEQQQQQQQLLRSPSLLQRFKSINLYSYFPTEPLSSNLATTHDTNVSNTTITYELENQLQQQQQHVYSMAVVEKNGENEEDDVVVGKIFQHNLKEHELPEQDGYIKRTQSDTKPTSGEVTVKLPKKMKKSASSKSAFSHFEEDEVVESRRPATVREKKSAEEDVEVDAKADDFINKFKQQLKLQRLDSIMRKEVIGE
ncbi:hypothetical protein Lalb_Chr22g0356091 [Lupinus albus]|uniref:DUF4408 domain-containing protein n=1 Tax=Lupinus albus TaxID=3870 RepID=A0A6A4NMA0_LUPAL|nr:hypothetical protein Lalb_Chr22g0356091 [Lupinus albus]